MTPDANTVELLHAVLAKLEGLEAASTQFRPSLRDTKEAASELGFGSMKAFYGWCSRRGIKCEKGLVDMNQIYAVWQRD